MPTLVRALVDSFAQLIPVRFRWAAAVLVLIGTAIPVTELLVTRMFTQLITTTATQQIAVGELTGQLVVFSALFVLTRLTHYGQRVYRVHFFDRAFRGRASPTSPTVESWEWALALELMNVLTLGAQLVVMAVLFTVIAPLFGLVNVALLLVLLDLVGRIFRRQASVQWRYVQRRRSGETVTPFVKLRSRVASAELGGIVSSGGVVVLLCALVAMNVAGVVTPANTIVLFLGLRMQNSTVNGLSGAVMRLARAQAHVRV